MKEEEFLCESLFQSLLSWMLPLNPVDARGSETLERVSILVILDVALEPHPSRTPLARDHSVSILVILDVALEPLSSVMQCVPAGQFQSLLSWMLPLNSFIPPWTLLAFGWFQSLLSWMLPLNGGSIPIIPWPIGGFNPCYPGCCP